MLYEVATSLSDSTMIVIGAAYVALWISLSTSVIICNKYVLSEAGFKYPLALTMIHMSFCSVAAFLIVRCGVVPRVKITMQIYARRVMPIGLLFSLTLWFSNASYLYLSVAFIQMVKAMTPCLVYLVGVVFGIEIFSLRKMVNMCVITLGVGVASWGELNFNWLGAALLLGAIMFEAARVVSIQILLQSQDIKFNPIQTLYYLSPICLVFLSLPFSYFEAPELHTSTNLNINISFGVLLGNAFLAFALNLSVFLLIDKTSALTMNVAGVVKDWILIYLSSILFKTSVTSLQLWGYSLAFLGVAYYNYNKNAPVVKR